MRLSPATLDVLPADVALPRYDRAAVKIGVVHLGIGAFHRAHQAVVFDDALASGDLRWGVMGASLRSSSVRDQLGPQTGLYTVAVRDGTGERLRVIGSVLGVHVAPEDPAALIEAMAHPDVHIVTLTITEKGYRLDPASGLLKVDDPEVAADLRDLSRPVTAPGFLVAALRLRRQRHLAPFTVISCDNLPNNGRRTQAAVLEMAVHIDPTLRDWIEAEVAFPQTMVDRIVPATTTADVDGLAEQIGVRDEGMVKTEPFTQWVIEDRFCGPRPDLASLGVELTDAVEPWENAKLRLLNGAHSALAYLGALSGYEFVHEAVAEPALNAFVQRLWDEAHTTLDTPSGLDLVAYRSALMARFSNATLRHRTRQIAMDGSQKLPQRLLNTVQLRLEAGQPIDALALAIAAWMRWQEGTTESGETIVVEDPLAAETAARLAGAVSDEDKVRALIGLEAVVPAVLAQDAQFVRVVTSAFDTLRRLGAVGAAASVVEVAG